MIPGRDFTGNLNAALRGLIQQLDNDFAHFPVGKDPLDIIPDFDSVEIHYFKGTSVSGGDTGCEAATIF